MERSQFLLTNGVTSYKIYKMRVQIREEARSYKGGMKSPWGNEVREIHMPVGVSHGRYHGGGGL